MKQQQNQIKNAIIFTNGPYQLMVGVACARFHIKNLEQIDVITYDMKWQKDLKRTTDEIINILNLNRVNFIFEFKKSDITNAQTYPIRAGLNHLTFSLYGLLQNKDNIFIPKLYGSPERA